MSLIGKRKDSWHEFDPKHHALNQMLGAVSYLNMLPFFCDDRLMQLFDTPAELNERLGSGKLLAGCSSVIAGLRSGLDLLPGCFGVASDHQVASVFFEPIVQSSSTAGFWQTILANNHLLASSFGASEPRLSGSMVASTSRGRAVKIFSSGASAQSIWILQTLLMLQGVPSEIVLIPKELADLSVADLHTALQLGEDLACLLTIGDPALERRIRYEPDSQNKPVDLAEFWNDFCGLPCVFAAWFLGPEVPQELSDLVSRQVAAKAMNWECLSVQAKLQFALNFLEQSNNKQLACLMGEEFLIEYLSNLKYRLSEQPYQESLLLMRTLFEAQHSASGSPLRPPDLNNFASKKVGVFKPFYSEPK